MAPAVPPRAGVYPGSFDPATVAHLHVAEAAVEQCGLDRVDLVISEVALGKDQAALSPVLERVAALEHLVADKPWLGIRTTRASLLADIAAGYGVVVVGADKWHQLLDPAWYGSDDERDTALRRLPRVALAARPPWPLPGRSDELPVPLDLVLLRTDPVHHPVSATAVRAGREDWRARR